MRKLATQGSPQQAAMTVVKEAGVLPWSAMLVSARQVKSKGSHHFLHHFHPSTPILVEIG